MTSKSMRTGNNPPSPWLNPMFDARKLQIAAFRTLPLHAYIASHRDYASQIARSINKGKFEWTMRLLMKVVPNVSVSTGAGFGTMFKMCDTFLEIGTYRPGKKVSDRDLQFISKTILPLLNKIATSQHFSIALLQHYKQKNQREWMRLVTAYIPAKRIKKAGTDPYGMYFVITTPSGAAYNFTLYIY